MSELWENNDYPANERLTEIYSSGLALVPEALARGRVTGIAAGGDHIIAITDDGRLHSWGYGANWWFDSAIYGNFNAVPEAIQTKRYYVAGASHVGNLAIAEDGTAAFWGFYTRFPEYFQQSAWVPSRIQDRAIRALKSDRINFWAQTTARFPVSIAFGQTSPVYHGGAHRVMPMVSDHLAATRVTYDGSATPPRNAGTYQVVATVDYAGFFGSATTAFTIRKADQQLFLRVPETARAGAAVRLSATASSRLPVSWRVVSGSATLAGRVLYPQGSGTVVVEATQEGDRNHVPAIPQSKAIGIIP